MALRPSSLEQARGPGRQTAFDLFHPAVALCYFALALALCMLAFHPVLLALSLVGAASFAALLRGWRACVRTALWQAPLVVVLALANPLFSASGSTELFRIGLRAVYLESLVYGLCMGCMLAAALLLLSNAAQVLSSDKIMELSGAALPVAGLMASMTARLVPQFVRRGDEVAWVQRANTAARGRGGPERGAGLREEAKAGRLPARARRRSARAATAARLRQVSVLMSWSMEDSLETAAAMKARGWGAAQRRSAYARHRFRRIDALALALVLALGASAAASAWAACAPFRFYPLTEGFSPWWVFAPFALFALAPTALELGERARWRS